MRASDSCDVSRRDQEVASSIPRGMPERKRQSSSTEARLGREFELRVWFPGPFYEQLRCTVLFSILSHVGLRTVVSCLRLRGIREVTSSFNAGA